MNTALRLASACVLGLSLANPAHAGEVEVLHWWTAGGEAKSAAVLADMLKARGHSWKDFAVAGGGGESAMTVLKTRAVAGTPPAAAQIKGLDIQEWAKLGFLTNLDSVAAAEQWDTLLPGVITQVMKYQGHYVAVPVNVHRVNWLWINPKALAKAGASVPTNWTEFVAAAEKLQAAGIIPLAHGGQPWQDATVFEAIALEVLGIDDYRKAFVMHDSATLKGPKMVEALTRFAQVRQFIDKNSAGRDWNLATGMLLRGEAGMQIMGDWAKGEITAAGMVPGKDILCVATPGTAGSFTFNIDSFAFFKLNSDDDQTAQRALASTILTPEFQEVFNLNKGSIPARLDSDMSKFDSCAQDSMATFKSANAEGKLVPSWSHGLATTSQVQGALYDVLTKFFNDKNADPVATADLMARAVRSAQ
ncbi:ABC transporter substrate-binding protein [Atopomonas sediminilitoris]|uniref:ABC transporter substrate-binding protein n=1 Tax=Atopomonas sediminilitoris TaxID=2919919 RepID=UPI00352172F1